VQLRNQPGLRTIYSPQFALAIERADDSSASIRYRANAAQPEQDFELYFGVDEAAVGLNVLSYKPAGEDGFFLLLAAPSVEVAQDEIVERDLILVVDVSGSMQGEKIEQARNAAKGVIDQLHGGDRFNLIAFSTGVRLWQSELQPASAENRQAARAWIDKLSATGSTDINRSLLEGLGQLAADDQEQRPAYMLFLTDGLPTMGETEPQRIINNALNNAPARTVRLFTFGVGFDVNTDLLDRLSRELGGRSSYVKPDEAIDEKISEFYAGISTPVLTDLQIDWQSNSVIDELYPYPLPDLFAGDQLVLVGRYRQGGPLALTLSGTANERELTFRYTGRSLVTSGGEAFVARLWATRKIGALLEQIRQHGPLPELVDEVVELSLAYGIVTPYTSYLVVEPELQRERNTAAPDVPLAERAQADALYALRESAIAPASGAEAVAASEMRSALVNAANVRQTAEVRYVAGKTFIQEALVEGPDGQTAVRWVDTAYSEEDETETVIFGSERYFALARQPRLAPWLALSTELIVVVEDGKALHITRGED
jgi:Ca-activated chloride channel family protein